MRYPFSHICYFRLSTNFWLFITEPHFLVALLLLQLPRPDAKWVLIPSPRDEMQGRERDRRLASWMFCILYYISHKKCLSL